MNRNTLFSIVTAATVATTFLTGCDLFTTPPSQLEAQLTLVPEVGELRGSEQLRALAADIVASLDIVGLDDTNTRVTFDESRKAYYFQVFGNDPVRSALLTQVAEGIDVLAARRAWPVQVKVRPLINTDTDDHGNRRTFNVHASWDKAEIVVGEHRPLSSGPLAEALRKAGHATSPQMRRCMIAFHTDPSLPSFEGNAEQYYANTPSWGRYQWLQEVLGPAHVFSSPYQISFVEPMLAKSFGDPLTYAKQGKLIVQFGYIDNDERHFGLEAPIGPHTKCERILAEKHADVQATIASAALLARVKSFGKARLMSLPVAK